jgi:hypothetical protein
LDEPQAGTNYSGSIGGTGTYPRGISGTNIVGYYSDNDGGIHGFIYNGITWATLDDPLGVGSTLPQGISGTNIVGFYTEARGLVAHGFLYNGKTWTTLDHPLAVYDTWAEGISGRNIVGYYYDNNNREHGFLATPAPPQLTITSSGDKALLSWPTNFPGYTLKSTVDLGTPTRWTIYILQAPPIISNGQFVVTIPVNGSNTQQFFRLSQ